MRGVSSRQNEIKNLVYTFGGAFNLTVSIRSGGGEAQCNGFAGSHSGIRTLSVDRNVYESVIRVRIDGSLTCIPVILIGEPYIKSILVPIYNELKLSAFGGDNIQIGLRVTLYSSVVPILSMLSTE